MSEPSPYREVGLRGQDLTAQPRARKQVHELPGKRARERLWSKRRRARRCARSRCPRLARAGEALCYGHDAWGRGSRWEK